MSPRKIVQLKVLPYYRLKVVFRDGTSGIVDLSNEPFDYEQVACDINKPSAPMEQGLIDNTENRNINYGTYYNKYTRRITMDFESLLKDASKEEGAGQYVLFDDKHQFLGQYRTTEEVSASIEEHHLHCPTLYDMGVLEDHTYIFIGGQLHVI